MSNADRVQLSYAVESAFGVVPDSVAYQELRFVSESFAQENSTTTSSEIRSDRMTTDAIRTNVSASGDLAFELSLSAYDEFIQAALESDTAFSTTTVVAAASTDISVTNNSDLEDATNSPFGSLAPGDLISISGFANEENNGVARVTSASATAISLNKTMVNEAAGASVTVLLASSIVNGVTESSYTFEKEFTDLSNEFHYVTGQSVNTMSLSISNDAIVTGTFGFIGSELLTDTASVASSIVAATTEDIMNGIDGAEINVDGTADYCLTAFSIETNNNLRTRSCIGMLGAESIGSGQFNGSGSFSMYFGSSTEFDKFRNHDDVELTVVLGDLDGNKYIFSIPRAKLDTGTVVASGLNTDVMAEFSFMALRDPSLDYMLKIGKIIAP